MIEDGHHVKQDSDRPTWVEPDTIGQFTSLYDKNSKEIYEGDILKAGDIGLLEVRFVRGVFAFLWNGNLDDEFPKGSPTHEWAEVIGNIHDNPKIKLMIIRNFPSKNLADCQRTLTFAANKCFIER